VLYLSYWIESAANRAKDTRNALIAGKAKLEEEIDAALDAYEAAEERSRSSRSKPTSWRRRSSR